MVPYQTILDIHWKAQFVKGRYVLGRSIIGGLLTVREVIRKAESGVRRSGIAALFSSRVTSSAFFII